jgi:hypothetical protein
VTSSHPIVRWFLSSIGQVNRKSLFDGFYVWVEWDSLNSRPLASKIFLTIVFVGETLWEARAKEETTSTWIRSDPLVFGRVT